MAKSTKEIIIQLCEVSLFMACVFCDGTLVAFETPIFSYTMVTDCHMNNNFFYNLYYISLQVIFFSVDPKYPM